MYSMHDYKKLANTSSAAFPAASSAVFADAQSNLSNKQLQLGHIYLHMDIAGMIPKAIESINANLQAYQPY